MLKLHMKARDEAKNTGRRWLKKSPEGERNVYKRKKIIKAL